MTTRHFRIAGRDHAVEILERGPDVVRVRIDGDEVDARFSASGESVRLTIQDRTRTVHVARQGRIWAACVEGCSVQVLAAAPASATGSGPLTITPPTPSVVVRVLVEVGQAVEKGQGVVVLSAMKMETTLVAPHDGEVTAVRVDQGDRVMPGDELVVVEPIRE